MKLISEEISRAEPEYMNIHPLSSVLAPALVVKINNNIINLGTFQRKFKGINWRTPAYSLLMLLVVVVLTFYLCRFFI